jgi:hypothetical protein
VGKYRNGLAPVRINIFLNSSIRLTISSSVSMSNSFSRPWNEKFPVPEFRKILSDLVYVIPWNLPK